MSVKISVIIPVYNVETYLRECVDSVLAQTFRDWELILVDDGSRDHSGAILDEYAERDSRVRVIHQENAGVSAARNRALTCFSGEYLYIMDSDDFLEPDALELLYHRAESTGADVVIADHYTFREKEEPVPHHFFSREFDTDDREIILKIQEMVLHPGYSPLLTRENTGLGIAAPWTKLLRGDFVRQWQLRFDPYVRGIFDDGLFALNVFEYARKVSYTRRQIYHYRILQSSLIHRFTPARFDIDRRVFERIDDFSRKFNKGDSFRKAVDARIVLALVHSFRVYLFHPEYSGSRRENFREFMRLIHSEPYRGAIRRCEMGRLNKKQKLTVLFARAHLTALFWLMMRIWKRLNIFRKKML